VVLGAHAPKAETDRRRREIFTVRGAPRHEVVFVYAGTLAEGDVAPAEGAMYYDHDDAIWVEWHPLSDADVELPL